MRKTADVLELAMGELWAWGPRIEGEPVALSN